MGIVRSRYCHHLRKRGDILCSQHAFKERQVGLLVAFQSAETEVSVQLAVESAAAEVSVLLTL